jgi:hypothetical protein
MLFYFQGKLFITTDRVAFEPNDGSSFLVIRYTDLIMHATQKANEDSFPVTEDSLYCQLASYPDFIEKPTNNSADDDVDQESGDGSDSEDEAPCQLWFCVENPGDLSQLFQAMNECSALNPDPEDEQASSTDDDDCNNISNGGGWTFAPGFIPENMNTEMDEESSE